MLRVICKSDLRLKSDLSDWKKESVEPFSNYRFWGVTMSFRFNLQLNKKSLKEARDVCKLNHRWLATSKNCEKKKILH